MNPNKLLFLTLTILGFVASASAQQDPYWLQLPTPPVYVQPQLSFSLGSNGYWTLDGTQLWRYNTHTNTWLRLNDLPQAPSGNPAFVIDNEAYYIAPVGLLSFLYKYVEAEDYWVKVNQVPGKMRSGTGVFVIGKRVYLICGNDAGGAHLADVWEFDADNNQWTKKNNFPFGGRWVGASFSINGKGYFGMGNINWSLPDPNGNDLYEYTPETDTWVKKANLPGPGRYAVSGFSMNGYGYILGGEKNYQGTAFLDEFWRYDAANDSWIKMPAYEGGGRNYLITFVVGNTCYAGKQGVFYSYGVYNQDCPTGTLTLSPSVQILPLGDTAVFTATSSDSILPSFIWQSDLGQGFQTLHNYGNYSGVSTATLQVADVQLANHQQQFRIVTTENNCFDTSNIATIRIADTCLQVVTDTTYITVADTLVLQATITGTHTAPTYLHAIKVFPNPASTHLTIDYGDFTLLTGYQLRIANVLGQPVFQTAIKQQSDFLNLSTWGGKGLYFIFLVDPQGNAVDTRKIVLN